MSGKITSWGDIPDDVISKPFLPLNKNLFSFIKQFGYDYFFEVVAPIYPDLFYDFLKERLDETILTAKETIEGKLEHPEITCSYMMYPPVVALRADLGQGTMKLMYGSSSDLCFYVIEDNKNEVYCIFNCHTEDGIPVDWWYAGPDDEIMDRRHSKLGHKFRDLNKMSKNFTQTGKLSIDMIRDIRNERNPQWASSTLNVCICYLTAGSNFIMCASNLETWSGMYIGANAKRIYKLPDYYFRFYPWPPMMETVMMLPREKVIQSYGGLTTHGLLSIQPYEPGVIDRVIDKSPEVYENFLLFTRKVGIPNPATTLACKPPNFAKKKTYEQEKFDFKYPSNAHYITLEDIELSMEELLKGVLLDVDFDFPVDKKVTPDNIISTGWGRSTVIKKR